MSLYHALMSTGAITQGEACETVERAKDPAERARIRKYYINKLEEIKKQLRTMQPAPANQTAQHRLSNLWSHYEAIIKALDAM